MKEKVDFYVTFPSDYDSDRHIDYGYGNLALIDEFQIEEIEERWGVEFFYYNGKTHRWYEENQWWKNDVVYREFLEVDGDIDLSNPPLHKGKQLKRDVIYIFRCFEDDLIRAKDFKDRLVGPFTICKG